MALRQLLTARHQLLRPARCRIAQLDRYGSLGRYAACRRYVSAKTADQEPIPQSSTAVIAPTSGDPTSPIAAALQDLAQTGFADEARIQLVVRSMEQGRAATVRVGILGKGQNVGRLVRLLLADPHVPEDKWERRIAEWEGEGSRRGLIIRWASAPHFVETLNEPVAYFLVPSPYLRESRVSILLTRLPTNHTPTLEELHTLTIAQRSAYATKPTIMKYAEHKTMIFSDSLDEFLENSNIKPDDTVFNVVNVPATSSVRRGERKGNVVTVNLDQAEAALKTRRTTRSLDYSRQLWRQSGLEFARDWILEGSGTAKRLPNSDIHPVVYKTILSILSDAADAVKLFESGNATLPPDVPTEATLEKSLDIWASEAHRELSQELENAFKSSEWRRLSWWSVLGNAEEIPAVVKSVVGGNGVNGMLSKAEREGWELFGRLRGAGYTAIPSDFVADAIRELDAESLKAVVAPGDSNGGTRSVSPRSAFPKTIQAFQTEAVTRHADGLLHQAGLLIRSFLTTSLASLAVSAALLVAHVSPYSASSAFALGGMLALRRFVRGWERAKGGFERAVGEGGAAAVRTGEMGAREILRGGRRTEESRGVEGRKAIGRVRRALRETGAFEGAGREV